MSKPKATGMKAADTRSRLSTEKKSVVRLLAKLQRQLDQANGLWRYWTTHDITENDDDWAAFSDAVRAHLDGNPVPARFVVKSRVRN